MSERLRKRSRPARRLALRGGQQGSGRVAQTRRGGGRRQGERQRARAQPAVRRRSAPPARPRANLGQRLAAQSSAATATARDRPARQRQPRRTLLDDDRARRGRQDRQRNGRTFAPTPRVLVPRAHVAVSPCHLVPLPVSVSRVSVVDQRVQPERSQRSHTQRIQLQPARRRPEQVEAGDRSATADSRAGCMRPGRAEILTPPAASRAARSTAAAASAVRRHSSDRPIPASTSAAIPT